uniref:Ribosomal protein S3 n=1 Tax=Paralemanea sp. TaxID=2048601 RepID=A0A343UXZ3_9FLOR|nr:ribosomal protein S3 [Paralemanea sp.]
MSRKINPTSFRLGLSQVWSGLFQVYGKNMYFYSNLLGSKFIIENYIKRLLMSQESILDSMCWSTRKKQITLLVTYKNLSAYSPLKVVNLKKLVHWLLNLNIKLYLLKRTEWSNSAALLTNYTAQSLQKSSSFKKTLNYVTVLLNNHLHTKKIVYNNKGIVSLKLKGFKLKISGRLDNVRNQMSKTSNCIGGSLPLSRLNSYVEYHSANIYTKSGVNGLHIWLFYHF